MKVSFSLEDIQQRSEEFANMTVNVTLKFGLYVYRVLNRNNLRTKKQWAALRLRADILNFSNKIRYQTISSCVL